jgi:hypothetical protein
MSEGQAVAHHRRTGRATGSCRLLDVRRGHAIGRRRRLGVQSGIGLARLHGELIGRAIGHQHHPGVQIGVDLARGHHRLVDGDIVLTPGRQSNIDHRVTAHLAGTGQDHRHASTVRGHQHAATDTRHHRQTHGDRVAVLADQTLLRSSPTETGQIIPLHVSTHLK